MGANAAVRHPVWLVSLLLCAACTRPSGYDDGAYDRRSRDTEYRIENRAQGGLTIHVRIAEYQFIPDIAALEERCRREAIAISLDEADRLGMVSPRVDGDRTRSSAGRNPVGGISSCTALAVVVPF